MSSLIKALHKKHSSMLSLADLTILAGCVAIEEMGGPHIPFACGRKDCSPSEAARTVGDGKINPNGSRLPPADLGQAETAQDAPVNELEQPTIDAVRRTFQRLGLTDRETVCLLLMGHQFGRCHLDVSGYEHVWHPHATHWNSNHLGYVSAVQVSTRVLEP